MALAFIRVSGWTNLYPRHGKLSIESVRRVIADRSKPKMLPAGIGTDSRFGAFGGEDINRAFAQRHGQVRSADFIEGDEPLRPIDIVEREPAVGVSHAHVGVRVRRPSDDEIILSIFILENADINIR